MVTKQAISDRRDDAVLMDKVRAADFRKYGPVGQLIRGSKYVRDYCMVCGAPIRVIDVNVSNSCESHWAGEKQTTWYDRRVAQVIPYRRGRQGRTVDQDAEAELEREAEEEVCA